MVHAVVSYPTWQGALIRTLNFDPKKSRGRAHMEHCVVGRAADIRDEGIALIYHILTSEHMRRSPVSKQGANSPVSNVLCNLCILVTAALSKPALSF
jgi:hypothetical protein